MRILIMEDDLQTAEFLREEFARAGFEPSVARDGNQALEAALSQDFGILVADIMVPGRDGISVVEELRRKEKNIPVIFLSAKHSLDSRLEGLAAGGDDYLTKPFSFSELLARCQAILRRSRKGPEARKVQFRNLELDVVSRTVKRGDTLIELHQKEFALLELLIRNRGQVVTKSQILENVWNYKFDPQTNVVDVLVCRLRGKLEKIQPGKLINTIRGVGYVLENG